MATYIVTSEDTTLNFGEPVEVRNTGSVDIYWRDATRGTRAVFSGDADALRLIARGPVQPGETIRLPRIAQVVVPTGGQSGEMTEPAGTRNNYRDFNMSAQLATGVWIRQSVDDGEGSPLAAADSHWLFYLVSPTKPARGVVVETRVPPNAAETIHALYQIREGEMRPSSHITRADWTVDGGTYYGAGGIHYYNLGAEGDYIEFDVPAAANGYDMIQLEVYSVDGSSGTVDATVDGGASVGTIATDAGSTTPWTRVSLALDTPLATGETVRLTRTATPSNSARIGEIMLLDSDGTPSAGDEVDLVGSGDDVTKPGSATELAIKAQPDGEGTAARFGSYGHQGGSYLTQTSVTESLGDLEAETWTPAYGWSDGTNVWINRDSTIKFDADDDLGSLYEWYTFDGAQLTYRWMFEASQALNLAVSSYAAMWPWDDAVTRLDVADNRISLDDDLDDNDYMTLPEGAITGVFGDRSDTLRHTVALLPPTGAPHKKTWLLYDAGSYAKVYQEIEVDSTFASGRVIGGGLNYALE